MAWSLVMPLVSADVLLVARLDGRLTFTLADALGVAVWTACCITAWRIIWGPRR